MDVMPAPWGSEVQQWDRFELAGVVFEGEVEIDAGDLWDKKNDHRRARGRNGGTTVATGYERVEVSVTLWAHDETTFAAQQAIIRRVFVRAPQRQDTSAFTVSHPIFLAASITQVLVDGGGLVAPKAGGKVGLRLKLKEFRAPSRPVTRAPAAATQGTSHTITHQSRERFGPPAPITMRPIPPPRPSSGP